MSINLGSSFGMQAALPLDDRMQVADLTARNAIPAGKRWEGMTVYCVYDTKTYQLKGGIANTNWIEAGGGGQFPGSSLDNEIARYDSTTGKIIKSGSGVTIADGGGFQGVSSIGGRTGDNLYISNPDPAKGIVFTRTGYNTSGNFFSPTGPNAVLTTPDSDFMRLTGTPPTNIIGITAPAFNQKFTLVNISSGPVTIKNASGTGDATILTGVGDYILPVGGSVDFTWNFSNGWFMKAGPKTLTALSSSTADRIVVMGGTDGKTIRETLNTIDSGNTMNVQGGLNVSGTLTPTGLLNIAGKASEYISTNATTTGANASLPSPSTPIMRLTNASLTSISMISEALYGGLLLTIFNDTGAAITLNNATGATANYQILTGSKANLTVPDQTGVQLKYDDVLFKWRVVGFTGSGTGGSGSLDTIFQLDGTDASLWSKGNNATFLAAGTLAGTFAADTTAPLFGTISYKYTVAAGSLNDWFVSPAKAVDPGFRGRTVTLILSEQYDGTTNDIEVIIYDATNSAIVPNSAFVQNAGVTSVLKTNVTMPLTCASIRVGFMVRVANAGNTGKIFKFDNVLLTTDATTYASISNTTAWTLAGPIGLSGATTAPTKGATATDKIWWRRVGDSMELKFEYRQTSAGTAGSGTYFLSIPGGYTIDTSKFGVIPAIENGVGYFGGRYNTGSTVDHYAGHLFVQTSTQLAAYFQYEREGGTAYGAGLWSSVLGAPTAADVLYTGYATVPILGWNATNQNILTAPETFSTDTAPLTFSSTYTQSTLANAPIGTYITITQAANSNTRTQSTTAPTQTSTDMNSNGIIIYPRAYNAASTSAQPAIIAIQIGKGHKGLSATLYKTSGRPNNTGQTNFYFNGALQFGFYSCENGYDPVSGVLLIDAGTNVSGGITSSFFSFSDGTTQGSGYLVINASKNPTLTGLNTLKPATVTVLPNVGTFNYTVPSGVTSLKLKMVGGGGGGAGSGTTGAGAGGAGGNTTFGVFLTANGGPGGIFQGPPNTGGGYSISAPAIGFGIQGGSGGGAINRATSAGEYPGGYGAASPFGGAGASAYGGYAPSAARPNSGSGGGGAGANTVTSTFSGGGGASGGYVEVFIPSPVAGTIYSYTVGIGGTAGTAGTSGGAGAAGGSGMIVVEEYY